MSGGVSVRMASEAQTSPPSVGGASNALPHLSGLDGLRGLAVIGVLLFHGGFTWAKGGFLGVSTFFTLSGFLITNLLVREFDRSSSIELLRFWGRRFRRLMPAAVVAIAVIGIVWWRIGTPTQLGSLRGDMVAALGYVANWRFFAAGTSYADLFSAPTPLQHFWSLAIEEQFYVFFPLIVIVLMQWGGRRLLAGVCIAAAGASIALQFALRNDFDRIYYGTDTRVAELLFGVLLAIWWSGRQRTNDTTHQRQRAIIDALGLGALVAMFIAWNRIPEASHNLARGGLPLYAAATTLIIYAATRPGLTTRILSASWLRWAGFLSYGLYLYHWPIFLWLSPERTGLTIWPLFALRMTITIAIAYVSWRFLEIPIRERRLLHTSRAAISAAAVSALAVTILAVTITLHTPTNTIPYADAVLGADDIVIETSAEGSVPLSGAPRSVWLIGDSAMKDLQPGLSAALVSGGTTAVMSGGTPGLSLTRKSETWSFQEAWSRRIATIEPDLIIVMLGVWDVEWLDQHSPSEYDAILDDALGILTAHGAHVLWITVVPPAQPDPTEVNRAFGRLADRHPTAVTIATIDESLAGPDGDYPRFIPGPSGEKVPLRKPDGWHFCQEGAVAVSRAIVDRLVELGWSHPAAPGWETGSWRNDIAYIDPPKGCANG